VEFCFNDNHATRLLRFDAAARHNASFLLTA
jgi:hypothetical protein